MTRSEYVSPDELITTCATQGALANGSTPATSAPRANRQKAERHSGAISIGSRGFRSGRCGATQNGDAETALKRVVVAGVDDEIADAVEIERIGGEVDIPVFDRLRRY